MEQAQAQEAYYRNRYTKSQSQTSTVNESKSESSSAAVSWPIILAIIPTLGAFIGGSAEIWSDFIMILLILYYVYKWITVPWSYYESARSRRIIYEYKSFNDKKKAPGMATSASKRKELVKEELRRHELIGLIWVILSPSIAGYTLQYSRYFLSNYDKYMSTFNITVFILAASIKPFMHITALLTERTLYLQREVQIDETQLEIMQKKIELVQEELDMLTKALATKRELGQMAQEITPTIQQLSKAIKRFEKKESTLRSWSEDRFADIDHKVQRFDQFICYSIEQDQHQSAQRFFVALILLPINLTFWAAKRLTVLLPVPKALIGFIDAGKKSPGLPSARPSKHLTHTDLTGVSKKYHNTTISATSSGHPGEESVGLSDPEYHS